MSRARRTRLAGRRGLVAFRSSSSAGAMIVQGLWNPFRAPCSASPPTTARPTSPRRSSHCSRRRGATSPWSSSTTPRPTRPQRSAPGTCSTTHACRTCATTASSDCRGTGSGRSSWPGSATRRRTTLPGRATTTSGGRAGTSGSRPSSRPTARPCSPTRWRSGSTTPGPSTPRVSGSSTPRGSAIPAIGSGFVAGELRGAGELVYGLMRRSAVERSGPFPLASSPTGCSSSGSRSRASSTRSASGCGTGGFAPGCGCRTRVSGARHSHKARRPPRTRPGG